MSDFFDVLKNLEGYQTLSEAFSKSKAHINVMGAAECSRAHILASLMHETGKRVLVISANELSARQFADELESFGVTDLVRIPPYDIADFEAESASFDLRASRITAVSRINKGASAVVSVPSLLSFVMPKNTFNSLIFDISADDAAQDLPERLVSLGYKRTPEVTGVGQFAVRGGIIDVFVPGEEYPFRIELFGDDVDTIRCFDTDTQLSVENIKTARIISADGDRGDGCITDYFGDETIIVFDMPLKISEAAKSYSANVEERLAQLALKGTKAVEYPIIQYESVMNLIRKKAFLLGFCLITQSCPDYKPSEIVHLSVKILSAYSGQTEMLADDVKTWLHKGYSVFIMAGGAQRAKGIREMLTEREIPCSMGVLQRFSAGIFESAISKSFEYPKAKIVFISGGDVFVKKHKRRAASKDASKTIRSFDELTVGDYVVHRNHGIGKFEGLVSLQAAGITRDYLKISYKGSDILYVPVNQLNLLYKYSYAGEETPQPKINKLGGAEWNNTKTKVKSNVKKLAIKLLNLYAQRSKMTGHAFSRDTEWQKEFEDEFIYEETPDQIKSIEEIKKDMESPSPMDRLLCGDVGYGKTEVAVRGAFKCIMDGYQCAYLVPTTILAAQHYNHFIERMKSFPVRIEMLSRFRTKAQQDKIIRDLKKGEIDVVIGTHRLLGKDVEFKNLGLLVIDEEQRFGVAHKEKIKDMKKGIDVLTLTATPIPRTLNMAMTGIRDMSVISMPPAERHPVQTYVMEYDEYIVKDAIERELDRGGQVYYVYNRVAGIYTLANKIAALVPDAHIAVAHGQMNERELEDIMEKVLDGEVDVLVCTTIIETGIDIPNVNTLIVENADNMGLSQLYQLRGRVGRSSRVAYAYLTFRRDKILSEVAEKRLVAIKEFTEFGSGFKIALRDLEIRGAGNILGPEQHGFMASVGYDMYLRLLSEAVTELKEDDVKPPKTEAVIDIAVSAKIPESYIADGKQRLEIYRLIADIETDEDKERIIDELIDRFGDVPAETNTLIELSMLRILASNAGISELSGTNNKITVFFDEKNPPSPEGIANIIAKHKKNILFSAGEKPYLTVKFGKVSDNELISDLKILINDLKV